MNRLCVGDEIQVTAGNHKGQKGKVARIDFDRGRVIVEGVNLKKRHMRATQETAGGIVRSPHRLLSATSCPSTPKRESPRGFVSRNVTETRFASPRVAPCSRPQQSSLPQR